MLSQCYRFYLSDITSYIVNKTRTENQRIVCSAWSWVPIPLAKRKSWQHCYLHRGFESRSRHGCLSLCFCVMLSCIVVPLSQAYHLSKGVLSSVLIILRNLRCEAAMTLTGIVEPLMMMTTMTMTTTTWS
jgi:hypothetical protein